MVPAGRDRSEARAIAGDLLGHWFGSGQHAASRISGCWNRADRRCTVISMFACLPENFPRRSLIEDLAGRLARHPAVQRVWLFGSRARGDNFERSDIDLAVEAPGIDRYEWLKITLDFEDEAPTLLSIDLVRLEEAPALLREQIRDEGILVYERARAPAAV
jgi:predicted nucleotidyltransferase